MLENQDVSEKSLFITVFKELFTLLPKLHRISEDLLLNADSDITHSCWVILSIISREKLPLSVPQIAELRSTSRQAVQRQISQLLEYGYIEAMDNPQNKRSPLYRGTEDGAAYHEEVGEKIYGQWLNDIAQNMGMKSGENLLLSIRQLDETLNKVTVKKSDSSK